MTNDLTIRGAAQDGAGMPITSHESLADLLEEQSDWVSALAEALDGEIAGLRGEAEEIEMRADDLERVKARYEARATMLFAAAESAREAIRPPESEPAWMLPPYGTPLVDDGRTS